MKDTKQVGDVSVAAVLTALLKQGKNVLLPFGDRQPYDLVIEEGGMFTRVQCKSGRLQGTNIRFNTSSVVKDAVSKKYKKKYYGAGVDLFGVYCASTNETYLVPSKDVVGDAEGVLRTKSPCKGYKNLMAVAYRL